MHLEKKKKSLLNAAFFLQNKWRQEQVCEAAGEELFGHFKVGKHSLGSDASLLHGLKAKKVLACLSSLVQMVRGMVPRASRELGSAWQLEKKIWIQVSALSQVLLWE